MNITRDGNKVTLTFTLADKPYVSKSEADKAAAAKRDPVAKALYSSGGFVTDGKGAKYALNVIAA